MSDLKTKVNNKSVTKFLESLENDQRREDSLVLLKLFKKVTKMKPKMWGDAIVGFGSYHYKYASGREGDWPLTGFSPRKQNLSLYIMSGFKDNKDLLKKLGKHKTSVACLYINKLEDIDLKVLESVIKKSVKQMQSSDDVEC